jgi:hypothetical protein
MIIEAAERVDKEARQIAHLHHADRHNVHLYNFDVDPKCPHPVCRSARERLEQMRTEVDKMRSVLDRLERRMGAQG